MKKLLLSAILFAIAIITANATHIAGADIQYRYIGDSTMVPNQYEVILRVYRDCGPGSATSISGTIQIQSSCYSNQSSALTKVNGPLSNGEVPLSNYEDCVNAGSVKCLSLNIFKGVVNLPGACSDFKFIYTDCCRPSGVDNLVTSNSQYFYVFTSLNNTLGPNSSALNWNESAKAFCVNQNVQWNLPYTDIDGDSLSFSLVSAKGNNGAPLAYTTGYTPTQPLITNPPGTFSLNSQTATMNFVPGATGSVIIALQVNEYRFDTNTTSWVLKGTNLRELIASVASTCTPIAQSGVMYDNNHWSVYPDYDNGLPTVDYDCYDSLITVHFSQSIDCSSISSDGSDFRLTSPSGAPIPVIHASAICNAQGAADFLTLKVNPSLDFNGTYTLYSKIGNDSNVIANPCGYQMQEFDTLQLRVKNCSNIGVDENNEEYGIILPNSYSPNGDGINDRFVIRMPENLNGTFKISITNAVGQVVYQASAASAIEWEIALNQKTLKPGMYYYILRYNDPSSGSQKTWKSPLSIYY